MESTVTGLPPASIETSKQSARCRLLALLGPQAKRGIADIASDLRPNRFMSTPQATRCRRI